MQHCNHTWCTPAVIGCKLKQVHSFFTLKSDHQKTFMQTREVKDMKSSYSSPNIHNAFKSIMYTPSRSRVSTKVIYFKQRHQLFQFNKTYTQTSNHNLWCFHVYVLNTTPVVELDVECMDSGEMEMEMESFMTGLSTYLCNTKIPKTHWNGNCTLDPTIESNGFMDFWLSVKRCHHYQEVCSTTHYNLM